MKVKTKGNKEEGLRNANLIAWVASQEALDLTSLAGRFFPLNSPRLQSMKFIFQWEVILEMIRQWFEFSGGCLNH